MASFYPNVQVDATFVQMWNTTDADGASITRSTDGTINVYKDTATTGVTTGVVDIEDFNSLTGVHQVTVDTSSDSDYYSLGSVFHIILEGATIDTETVNHWLGSFSIGELIGVGSTASDNADNIAIANRALAFLGQEQIDSFSDDNKRAEVADLMFNPARDSVLELHKWKAARALATLVQDTTYTGTAGTWASSVATLTIGTHTVEVDDDVTVADWEPTGYNGDYTVTAVTASTISYALSIDPGTATTFGTVLDGVEPDWKYDNQFSLPSDFVRHVSNQDQGLDYEIHGDKMLTDQSDVKMEYVFALTTVSDMGAMLKETIAAKLAYDMSFMLRVSDSKKKEMERLFDRTIELARNVDASQRPDDRIISDEWQLERLAGNRGFRSLGTVPTE